MVYSTHFVPALNRNMITADAALAVEQRLDESPFRAIHGRDHCKGSYYLEWWEGGRRYREAAGPNAFAAADKVRAKQAELDAVRNGIIPAEPVEEVVQERTTLKQALDAYKDYVRYHRSLRTFRTYRPILKSFKEFCGKTYVVEVERQDFIDFATHCMKRGKKVGASITSLSCSPR
jgi:hypothetical protein